MKKLWGVLLSGLLIFLLSNTAFADLSEGTYSLDTGTWHFTYGPGPGPTGSTVDSVSNTAGQWSIYNSYYTGEGVFLGNHNGDVNQYDYIYPYQNSIMSIALLGKTYSNVVVSGEYHLTVVMSGGTIGWENLSATGTAYIQENGIQYKLDLFFTYIETERFSNIVNGDVTSVQVVVSTIPVGIEEGHFDSVSSTPLIELGTWTTDVNGFYPSFSGSIGNAQSTGGQWSVSNVVYGTSKLSGPGHVEVPFGGDTYIYETYTVPVSGGTWLINYKGKEYNPTVYGTIEWTGIWRNYLSGSTFVGLTGVVATYKAFIEEYGIKYECTQVKQYGYSGTAWITTPYGHWQHWGDITRIDLDIKAITPQTVEVSDPILVDPTGTYTYDAGLEMESGDLAGAKILFNTTTETVQPTFGAPSNIPDLVSSIDTAVGEKLNLLPHGATFTTPVRIFIPCPGVTDVSKLSVYNWNEGSGWVKACNADGTVLLTDWMVAGSRVNHNETTPKTIEIKIYHFSAAQATLPKPERLAVDFNSNGLYAYNGLQWGRLSSWNPEGMEAYGNTLAVDFGTSGLYSCNGAAWQRLSSWNPEGMAEWLNGLAVDFGGNGLYTRNDNSWTRISSWNSAGLLSWYKGLMVNFGSSGLYTFDGMDWKKLSNWNSEGMNTAYGSDAIVDFGTNGLYLVDQGAYTWRRISTWNAEGYQTQGITTAAGYAVDFGENGLWLYDYATGWRKISNLNPDSMTLTNNILVVDFGVNGLWCTSDGNSWSSLSSNDAAILQPSINGIAVDFGAGGIGLFNCDLGAGQDNASWTKLSSWLSGDMTTVNFE